jgi:hypothetical protein
MRGIGRRASRRGRFVVVVGPDGVGKTTLAGELLKGWPGERRYFHFRPPIRRTMQDMPTAVNGLVAVKADRDGSRILGWFRLLRNLVLFTGGYLTRVRLALRRGALVVGDRWAYGYLAAPRQLKYYGPEWLARWVISVLPEPDLVVCLTAPSQVVVTRKAELTVAQVKEEDRLWQSVPARRKITLVALGQPEALAAEVLRQL